MNNPLNSDGFRNLSLLLARLALGTYFILAAYSKFAKGWSQWVTEQVTKVPSFLPPQVGKGYLYALPPGELLVGVALVVGFFTRTSATLIALMLISFMIAVTGVGKNDPTFQIDKNLVFLGLALLLMNTGGGQIAVDASMGGGGGGSAPGPRKK